jgi:glycosyltransferase involved in cell wall biosynthesis
MTDGRTDVSPVVPRTAAFSVTTKLAFATPQRDLPGTGVTVVVSSYNYERYILDTLSSVQAQSHRNLELIVVDGCSSDRSAEIAERWIAANGARFSCAKLLSHAQNYGLFQARNTGFENASNEFVFVLDSDDLLYPTAIAKLLDGCVHADAQVAYSQLEFFDEAAEIGPAGIWNPGRLAHGNYIDALSLVRKSAWQAVGGFARLFNPGHEDYDLWCKFVEHGFTGAFIPEVLCRYRIHGDSMYQKMSSADRVEAQCEMIVRHPWMKL